MYNDVYKCKYQICFVYSMKEGRPNKGANGDGRIVNGGCIK